MSKDGICGALVEHSASEGIIVLRFLDDFLKFEAAAAAAHSSKSTTVELGRRDSTKNGSCGLAGSRSTAELVATKRIVRLQWQLDEATVRAVLDASKKVNKYVHRQLKEAYD